jgi:tetratricopeptide (TPR) repeat protein
MLGVRVEQNRLDELLETVQRYATKYSEFVHWRCALARVCARLKRTTEARQQLQALAHADFEDFPRNTLWLSHLLGLCEVVVLLDDAPNAQLLYRLLSPYGDRCGVSFALMSQGSASRPLGLLATTLMRYDEAARHFEQALTMNARIRSALWVAHTQHDYARMLLQRNQSGDREKALELLHTALATAEQLGLKALADEARPLKLGTQAVDPPPTLPSSA